jgi:hypothetical protein
MKHLSIVMFAGLLLALNLFYSHAAVPNLSNVEFNSLQDLYNVTFGKNWIWFNYTETVPWNFSIPNANPCLHHWQGLQCSCDPVKCQVTLIDLEHHNLSGRLPNSIGNFPQLTIISFRGNSLQSVIPSEIGDLSNLETLDFSYNLLQGQIPSSIGNLHKLKLLNLDVNRLTAIPEELYNCHRLETLSVVENKISGTLSNRIGNLTNLRHLAVFNNSIHSTLPESIGNLTHLETLDISQNYFYSTLPNSISNLLNLTIFTSESTAFTGRLPEELGNLKNLQSLGFPTNRFFGSLPASLGYLPKLTDIVLNTNLFSGTIPASYSKLTRLLSFYLEVNIMYGNLSVLQPMKNLLLSQMNNNFFTGSIEGILENKNDLILLDVSYNSLNLQLPYSPNWDKLIIIEFNNNYFTGGITGNYQNLDDLNYFVAADNYLTGKINEAAFFNCSRLATLALSNNLFSGSLPRFVSPLPQLSQLYLNYNFFTGNIPEHLDSSMKNLAIFSAYSNLLTGSVSVSSISQLKFLEEIFIQDNSLSGPVENVFNATNQKILNTVDVSSNQFTGTIPLSVVTLPKLQSLILSTNCLRGSISENLCSIDSLISLSLDGLATAPNCRVNLFPESLHSIFNSFVLKHYIAGTIPSCLLEMENIKQLQLSGNGLTGSIPVSSRISPTLSHLSLSHNILTGTIPVNFQNRSWSYLDMSYNKLSGTLQSWFSFNQTSSLYLDVNRISGNIPSGLVHVASISMLDGNIFSCDISGNDLPVQDPDYGTYSCGSDNVNYILYVWGVCLFVFLPIIAFCLSRWISIRNYGNLDDTNGNTSFVAVREISKTLISWKNELKQPVQFTENDLPDSNRGTLFSKSQGIRNNLYRLSVFFSQTRKAFIVLMLYCIVILLPLDSVLKINYSSYTVEYAWTVSGMLLEGEVPAILLFISLFFLIILTQYLFNRMIHIIKKSFVLGSDEKSTTTSSRKTKKSKLNTDALDEQRRSVISEKSWEIFLVYLSVFLFNVLIMSIVDFSYVYIVITYDSLVISLAAVALAVFRLVTNNTLLWNAIPLFLSFFLKLKVITLSTFILARSENESISQDSSKNSSAQAQSILSAATTTETLSSTPTIANIYDVIHHYSPGDISFLEKIILFNNVVIPCLAIIFILPDCFYNALFASSQVDSTFTFISCNQYFADNQVGHVCSTDYQTISYSPPYIYSYQCSSKIIINYVPVYVFLFLIVGLILPLTQIIMKLIYDYYNAKNDEKKLEDPENQLEHISRSTSSLLMRVLTLALPNKLKLFSNYNTKTGLPNGCTSSEHPFRPNSSLTQFVTNQYSKETMLSPNEIIFSKAKITIQINSYLTIMISFGALFPPLAFLACFTILVVTLYEEIVLGRLLTIVRANKLIYYEMKINQECYHIEEGINLTLWSTLFVSCCLYSYIIFDTMGDENGWEEALPMTIILFCLPFILYLGKVFYDHCGSCCFDPSDSADTRRTEKYSVQSHDPKASSRETSEGYDDETNPASLYSLSDPRKSDIQMVSRDSIVVLNKSLQKENSSGSSFSSPSADVKEKHPMDSGNHQITTENPLFLQK